MFSKCLYLDLFEFSVNPKFTKYNIAFLKGSIRFFLCHVGIELHNMSCISVGSIWIQMMEYFPENFKVQDCFSKRLYQIFLCHIGIKISVMCCLLSCSIWIQMMVSFPKSNILKWASALTSQFKHKHTKYTHTASAQKIALLRRFECTTYIYKVL